MDTRKITIALTCGAVAGPLFTVVGLAQAATRAGFDPTKHQLSILSTGSLGWVQMLTFVVTGALFLAGAMGMRATLTSGRGSRWGPRLITIFGAGMIGAGIFRPDPAFGFPPGTPDSKPDPISWHGALHYSIASIAFLALIIAAVVFARRFAAEHNRGWALASAAAGAALLVGVAAVSTGSTSAVGSIVFIFSALAAFLWASALAAHLRHRGRRTRHAARPSAGEPAPEAPPAGSH